MEQEAHPAHRMVTAVAAVLGGRQEEGLLTVLATGTLLPEVAAGMVAQAAAVERRVIVALQSGGATAMAVPARVAQSVSCGPDAAVHSHQLLRVAHNGLGTLH
jgi:hypothetical protein